MLLKFIGITKTFTEYYKKDFLILKDESNLRNLNANFITQHVQNYIERQL
jgi:hypothetical protein